MQSNKPNTDLVCPGYLVKTIYCVYFNSTEIREIVVNHYSGYTCLYNSNINKNNFIDIELLEVNSNKWYSLAELNAIKDDNYLLMMTFTHVRTKIKK